MKGLLDRFKVQPEVFRREEYKVGASKWLSRLVAQLLHMGH